MLRAVARGTPGTLWRRIYNVPNPAAGADVAFAVPAHKAWQLLGVSATLTASAIAGNRFPALTFLDVGGIPLGKIACPTAIVASDAPVVSWLPGVGAATVVPAAYASLTLPADWYMLTQESLTLTGHTDVGDQWSNIRVTVLETNTGDPDYIANLARGIEDHLDAIAELRE